VSTPAAQPPPWTQDPSQQQATGQPEANGQAPPPAIRKCPCGPAFAGRRGLTHTPHYFAVHTKDGLMLDPAESFDLVPTSELQAAVRIIGLHIDGGHPILFAQQSGRWLMWADGVYAPQPVHFGTHMAQDLAVWLKSLLREMEQAVNTAVAGKNPGLAGDALNAVMKKAWDLWKDHRAFCKHLWSERGQAAMIKQLERSCGIDEAMLDVGTGEIVIDGGRISAADILRDGAVTLLPHDPEIRVTKRMGAGVGYDPAATCPVFDQFLATSVADEGQRDWLCWRTASALFGRTRKGFVNPIGETDSGKSTFTAIIARLAGDYAKAVAAKTFMVKHASDSGFLDDELRGARFVSTHEPEPGSRFAVGYVKAITGQDRQRTAGKYAKPVEWTPQCTPFIGTNRPILFDTSDEAMMRRQEAVRFARGYTIRDEHLERKMAAELPGILNRLLSYLVREAQHGPPPLPASMVAERERLATETEPALAFVDEALEARWLATCGLDVAASNCVQVTWLYREFERWCFHEGIKPGGGRKTFSNVVGRRCPVEKSNGYRFLGLIWTGQDAGSSM
jgi:P4 family phage/plasmid primase-like protien